MFTGIEQASAWSSPVRDEMSIGPWVESPPAPFGGAELNWTDTNLDMFRSSERRLVFFLCSYL